MPYLGNIPATQFSSLAYQDLTGGTGTAFTLDNAVGSAQDIEVFVNNVRQEPGVAYTVSGTSLTMTGSIVATDDFYVVFQGKSVASVTHPSNSALNATTGTFTSNVLVGKTSADSATDGVQLLPNGISAFGRDGGEALRLNRNTSDGEVLRIQKAGVTVGSIVADAGDVTIGTDNTGLRFFDGGNAIIPRNTDRSQSDNVLDLGSNGNRFDDIYATNTTIQTSDANEKQQIASLTSAEITAAKAISQLFKTYKWNSAVESKGDDARTHTGVIAQEVQQAMTDAGLDAGDYAFFISSTWWEHEGTTYDTQEEAPEGATQRTRLGVRYPELLAFIGAATEQRLADIETRLTALEGA